MVMDLLRSCYYAKIRPYPDSSQLVEIRWYFAPDNAKVFPGPHAFPSLVWNSELTDKGGVGPLPGNDGWAKSTNYRGYKGQCYTGELEWFRSGIPYAQRASVAECLQCATWPVGGGGLVLGGLGVSRALLGQPGSGGLVFGGLSF
jgi:hypothetical protein